MGGASAGSGGSDKSDEKKVDTYADQLKKIQAKKNKKPTLTDKLPTPINIIKQIGGNFFDRTNLEKRMKFANKHGINIQGLSTEQILSKDFRSKLDAKGYVKGAGNTGGNDNKDNNNNQTVLNTEAKQQVVSNNITAPTNAEVTKAQSTDMSADQILLANNKKGRKQTILKTASGLGDSTLQTTKKTLGA